jgi:hypothetical protein
VIPDTGDPRRFIERWGIVLIIVVVASMIGIRACSVHLRSRGSRGSSFQKAQQLDDITHEAGDVEKTPETATVNPLSAFEHAACAWNEIEIDGSNGGGSVIVGDLHNNASRDGRMRIDGGNVVYGRVTSTATVAIGLSDAAGPTTLYGSIDADTVLIGDLAEIRDFLDLHESMQGVDLDHDGDLDDLNFGTIPAQVTAARRIVCGREDLTTGGTDARIADGTRSVEIGRARRPSVPYVYPDFRAYYEATTGVSSYPPEKEHVAVEILGDGQAHYFASASVFRSWINSHQQTDVLCWRCAGDGSIGPDHSTVCPDCRGRGKIPAVEVAGVFYIDDETLDLSDIETHLVVHGTIVVAEGNPYGWPSRRVEVPGLPAIVIDHFPEKGSLTIGGPTRMSLTQTSRSDREGGSYVWRQTAIHKGADEQYIAMAAPEEGHALSNFPGIVAASRIVIAPRAAGFARCQGDIGDEAMTILRGVLFAGDEIRLGGRGGWSGDPIQFDEKESRGDEDILDEAVLRIDLNDDGDVFDRLRLSDVSARPVIRVGKGRYTVDINNDGVLNKVIIGEDYGAFFAGNGYALPVLVYHEGTLIGDRISVGGQCAVLFDPLSAAPVAPAGFVTAQPHNSSSKSLSLLSHIPSRR